MARLIKTFYIIWFICLFAGTVFAGSSQVSDKTFFKPEEIVNFSKEFEKFLAEKKVRVAIVARAGRYRDKLPEGISFTHVAFAVYSQITTKDGRKIPGYAIYNLYQKADKPDQSYLMQDYPVDFFAGVKVLEAGIIIPKSKVQIKILKTITSETYKNLHNPKYSVLANPYTLEFQNCTEHTLDVIFAAIYQTTDIQKIKENEKAYFKAQSIDMNPLLLSLGSIFSSGVAISDHPDSPETVTFTTIGNFMEEYGLSSKKYILKPSEKTKQQML